MTDATGQCEDCGRPGVDGCVIYRCDEYEGGCGRDVCADCSVSAGPHGATILCDECAEWPPETGKGA